MPCSYCDGLCFYAFCCFHRYHYVYGECPAEMEDFLNEQDD